MTLTSRFSALVPGRRGARAGSSRQASGALVIVAFALAACGTSTPTNPPQSPGSPAPSGSASAAPTSPPATASPAASPSADFAAPTAEPGQTVKVPVASCPTTFGMPGESMPPVPATMTATISSDLAAQVVFFTNGALTLLGPKGWTCSAAVGVDGSSSMSITPPGQTVPSASPPPDFQAITASTGGACVGCIATMACAIFPEAWNLFAQPGMTCPSTIPERERITRPVAQSAVFEDPAGVAGTGDPSGGKFRALGYLVFDPGSNAGGTNAILPSALKITCTLADTMSRICDETVEGAPRAPSE